MKFIIALLLVLIPAVAFGAPFVRCDQYIGAMGDPDYFKIFIDSGAAITTPTFVYAGETGDSIHYDLVSLPVGQHTIKVQACKAATLWQAEVCSADSSPLVLTRPVPVVATHVPVRLGLSAQ